MTRKEAAITCRNLAREIFDDELLIGVQGSTAFYLRFAALLIDLELFFRHEDPEDTQRLLARLHVLFEEGCVWNDLPADVLGHLRTTIHQIRTLPQDPPVERRAWWPVWVTGRTQVVPSMLHRETMSYYKWLAGQLTGAGEVVELGGWMGCSTRCLGEGLLGNPAFGQRRVHVFDSFVWERWMGRFVDETLEQARCLKAGQSYLSLFRRFTEDYAQFVEPCQGYLYTTPNTPYAVYNGTTSFTLAPFCWDGSPIELFIYDMGSNYSQVEKAWNIFASSFIAGKTCVVFQEYGKVRSEAIRRFCLERQDELRPVHKPGSTAKGFLFTGCA